MALSLFPLLLLLLPLSAVVDAVEISGDSLRGVAARVVAVSPGNPGSASVLVQWQAFDKQLRDDGTTGTNILLTRDSDPVVAYEVQSTVSGADAWVSLDANISGMSVSSVSSVSPRRRDRHEKQRVFTRVDAGETITSGVFRLALSHAGTSALDMHQHTVTPPIAFDASESDLKAALETLDVVSNVQVFRRVLDAAAGTVEWIVIFDPPSLASPTADHGDLPLLTLYSETISAIYSGAGDQVAIQSVREGIVDGVVCEDDCGFTADGLMAGQALAFRVRARFTVQGWSQWSRASEPLTIPSTPLPRAPTAPELLAATASRLTIQWTSADTSDVLFPVLSFHLQQKCGRDLSWRSVDIALPPGRIEQTVSSSTPALLPNTSCAFRVAATNANGVGPFSAPSALFRTSAAAPLPPRQLAVLRVPTLRLAWQPPASDGGSLLLAYDLELRVFASSTWVRVPATAVDADPLGCDLSSLPDPLAPFTRYAARIRARNAMGASAFVAFPSFLTDFRAMPSATSTVTANTDAMTKVTLPATRQRAANTGDLEYVHGVASGGLTQGQDGEHGVVLVFFITMDGERLDEQPFYFTGRVETIWIPQDNTPQRQIVAIDVYAWGGGGGSGDKAAWGTGGGGAFARGIFRVSPGDSLQILVGGGGQGSARGGRGGWNGGGNGGAGGFSGGGGGGASELRINNKTVVVAAGGGGGGSSDYCCAHGGGGGGGEASAEDGLFPDARAIPLDSRITGIPRNEYHSINVEGDFRDTVGLPARHNNLDFGFAAASADYAVLATGGHGASALHGGAAGQPASYVVSRFGKCILSADSGVSFVGSSLSASQASPGLRGIGGSGQDGQDCGGGGGGGFFGGGGGGAGMDGTGGGGGSSYVAVDLLFTRANTNPAPSQERVTNFTAQAVTSTSVLLSWQEPRFRFQQPVQGLIVEMANRSANENFRVIRLLPPKSTSVLVESLRPAWTYRFRVKPLFRDAAHGAFSDIRTCQTPPTPVNTWRLVRGVRSLDERTTHAGSRSVSALPARRLPSARRGHSLTAFDDGFLYLFGGFSGGYPCGQAHKAACVVAAGVNNELWRFDTRTQSWLELATVGGPPPAREKHTMAVVANQLLLVGGRQGGLDDATAALNDLWSLQISSTTRKTTMASLQNREINLVLRDGGETLTIANVGHPPDQCVAAMVVTLDVTHACMQSLRIELLGPGPSTHPQRQQSATSPIDSQTIEATWSDPAGFGTGAKRATSTTASARSFPVTLQRPEMASAASACLSGRRTLTFSSSSSLEPLNVFRQFSAAGGWTLSVLDTLLDGKTGVLNSWDISFTLTPCVPTWTWTNIGITATGAPPTPRFQHAAIVYQSSLFVYGGRSAKPLNDLFRLDYNAATNTGTWTTLLPVTATRDSALYHGRVVLLTPYELLAIGQGLRSRATSARPHVLTSGLYAARKSVTEPLAAWQPPLTANGSQDDATSPLGRYWSSAVFTSDPKPRVYVYGGQDDTALMSDLWELQLDALVESQPSGELETKRLEICTWRLANTVLQQKWTASCGASSASVAAATATECSLDTLLLYAWCTKTYQSLTL